MEQAEQVEQALSVRLRLTTAVRAVQVQLEPAAPVGLVRVVQRQAIPAALVQLEQPEPALAGQEQAAVQPRAVLAELRQPAERVTAVQAAVRLAVQVALAVQVVRVAQVEPVAVCLQTVTPVVLAEMVRLVERPRPATLQPMATAVTAATAAWAEMPRAAMCLQAPPAATVLWVGQVAAPSVVVLEITISPTPSVAAASQTLRVSLP